MARSRRTQEADTHPGAVVVIGLGRFGKSLALELMQQGIEVLGVDSDQKIVQSLAGRLTHVVVADATNEDALRQLSTHDFDRAVIGVGNDLEVSILAASVTLGLGVEQVWAKAISHAHARILTQIGVHHVVRPEHDMGKRVAHLVVAGCSTTSRSTPTTRSSRPSRRDATSASLGASGIRQDHGVTVVGVKRGEEAFTYASAETVLEEGDVVIVSGPRRNVERFSELT